MTSGIIGAFIPYLPFVSSWVFLYIARTRKIALWSTKSSHPPTRGPCGDELVAKLCFEAAFVPTVALYTSQFPDLAFLRIFYRRVVISLSCTPSGKYYTTW